jgi:hypothetical protein
MQIAEIDTQTLLREQPSFVARTEQERETLLKAPASAEAMVRPAPGAANLIPDDENKPHFSKSSLNRYIACPFSYFLQYRLKFRPIRQDMNLVVGSATHHLIASHYQARKKGEIISADAAQEAFWSRYSKKESPTDEERRLADAESRRYAGLFLAEVSIDPMEIEMGFSVPIVNLDNGDALPVPLVGFIDLLDQFDGIPRPLEIKTRARKADVWNVRMSLEMTAYAYWVKYTTMIYADKDIPVGYLNIIKTKTPTIQEQTDTRNTKDFLDFYRTAEAVWKNIGDERFYRNPGPHCNWCDFLPICRRDRDVVEQTFGEAACLDLWEKDLI